MQYEVRDVLSLSCTGLKSKAGSQMLQWSDRLANDDVMQMARLESMVMWSHCASSRVYGASKDKVDGSTDAPHPGVR